MNQLNFPIISFTIFFPMAGVFLLLFIRGDKDKHYDLMRKAAFVISLFVFAVSLAFPIYFNSETPHMQFVEHVPWVKSMGISYFVGIDGISLWLVVLTTFLVPLCILCSWTYIQKHVKAFLISMLLLETLHLLGAYAHTHVPAHRCLGRTEAHLCRRQVFPVHSGRKPAHVCGDYLSVLL
jgi:NADH-quinone oxidoreductase subunit M